MPVHMAEDMGGSSADEALAQGPGLRSQVGRSTSLCGARGSKAWCVVATYPGQPFSSS